MPYSGVKNTVFYLQKNKNLRLLVSSATVDAEHVRDFFNLNVTKNEHADTSTILSIEGRLYPVDCFYVKGYCSYSFSSGGKFVYC